MPLVTGLAASALERSRDRLNARFALSRKSGDGIDPDAFLDHLATAVGPLIESVAEKIPDRTTATTEALFDVSLELFSAALLGPGAKSTTVRSIWTDLLPQIPTDLLARDPRQIAAAFSNAAANISATQGSRPSDFVTQLIRLCPACKSIPELIDSGKIAAWKSGMVQYRPGALNAAHALRPDLCRLALNLPPTSDVPAALDRLAADPWLAPANTTSNSPATLAPVARVGAFKGLGGPFLRPPTASTSANRIYLTDRENTWHLLADHYGHLFVREQRSPQQDTTPNSPCTHRNGKLIWGDDQLAVPSVSEISSLACDGRTVAVTTSNSHHVFLFARVIHATQ